MITPLPLPPSRSDPANFSQRADDFMGALPTFVTETNATAVAADVDAASALQSKIDAAASAAGANASANVTKWVSGVTYQEGDVVWSPANTFSYRRKTAAGSGTTDPSTDSTNYTLVSGAGNVQTDLVQTLTNKTLDSTCSLAKLSGNRSSWVSDGVITNVVGQLAWKAYGNGHTIFDASAGLSPEGTTIDVATPVNPWAPNFPTLMGWAGGSTYGVRVDSCRLADNATTSTTDNQHFGIGQTWQDVTGSRVVSTTYYNTTVKPISVGIRVQAATSGAWTAQFSVNGVNQPQTGQNIPGTTWAVLTVIIPPGNSYIVTGTNLTIPTWIELR